MFTDFTVALLSGGFRSGPNKRDASRGSQSFVLSVAVGVAGLSEL